MAVPPLSPVLIRIHSSNGVINIFPSPTAPSLFVRAAFKIVLTVISTNSSFTPISILILGIRSGTIICPLYISSILCCPWPETRLTVILFISASMSASRTLSSLTSLIIAVIIAVGYAALMTYIIIFLLDKVIKLKSSESDEMAGLDRSYHGERGYGMLNPS